MPPPSESSSRRPTLLQADVAWVSIGSADPPIEGYLSISCRATVSGELQASWEEPGVPDSQAKWSVARQGCDTVERVREAPYGLLKGRKRFPGLLRVRVCEPGVRSRGISHRRCSAPARVAVTGAQYYTPDQAERYYSRAER